ncbi:MAG: serine-rich protein [Candidatus Hadarchaeales archaeon]
MILNARLRFANGEFQYAVFKVLTPSGKEIYNAVTFQELKYIPQEARADPDVLPKMHLLLRSLYDAKISIIYAACGIYHPERLGIVQLYGARGQGSTEEEAAEEAMRAFQAVKGGLSANYPQIILDVPEPEKINWFFGALERMKKIGVILGHPDPRKTAKGLGRDGLMGEADDELASQQNELLYRALAALGRNFIYTVVTKAIPRKKIAEELIEVARIASNYASRIQGSIGVSFTIAVPLATLLGTGYMAAKGKGDGWGHTVERGESETWGKAHTVSQATTESESVSKGIAHSVGGFSGVAHTKSGGTATTTGTAHTDSHSWGTARTEGSSWSTSTTTTVGSTSSTAHSVGSSATSGHSGTVSYAAGSGVSSSSMHTHSSADTTSTSVTAGQTSTESHSFNKHIEGGASLGASAGMSVGIKLVDLKGEANAGINAGGGVGWTDTKGSGTSLEISQGSAHTTGMAHTSGVTTSFSQSVGAAYTASEAHTVSESTATSSATTTSYSTTTTHGGFSATTHTEGWGTADTTSRADTRSESWGTTYSSGSTWSTTTSEVRTKGIAHTHGTSDTQSYAKAVSKGEADSVSGTKMSGGGAGWAGGFSAGIVPGLSISRAWQTVDDTAARAAEILRMVESLLNQAAAEGGFMTSTYLLAEDDETARAAQVAAIQAFHGVHVPTPPQVIWVGEELRPYVRSFTISPEKDRDPFNIGLWTKYATLLTPEMVAAYTAPGLFEEGTAVTVQEKIPPVAFYPELEGDITLGHQISPETGLLTAVPLKLGRDDYFHTGFFADTGYGKTVAAMRMVYESALKWGMKTLVLDFGAGWRALFNAPGLEGRVDIRQLSPGGVRPLRWNPLQIGRYIMPEVQWRAFCDIFAAVARLGVRRQIGELRDALREVYLRYGVLVDDPDLPQEWACVRPEEEGIAGQPAGTPLTALPGDVKQRIVVERSKLVGLEDLYDEIEKKLAKVPARDTMLRGVLEGILSRLHPLVQGAAKKQYAPGKDAHDIASLVEASLVVIFEGGAFLDEFSKAFLLALTAWQVYMDAVVRRIRGKGGEPIQIVFEEANKILSGVEGDEEKGAAQWTAEQLERMWLDSRKYNIWLHIISQKPFKIPPGILSSCANIIVGQIKDPRDRDLITAALARSEKGFVDETWRRFLARLPVGRMVGRFGYSRNMSRQEPVFFEPLMLLVKEPDDGEIERILGKITV